MINFDKLLNVKDLEIKGDVSEIDAVIEYEEVLLSISKSLRNYRIENNLTQRQLARKLGIKQEMISKLESGNYNPTFKLIHKISRDLTNSANLFLNILKDMIKNITNMYSVNYKVEYKMYSYKNEGKMSYLSFTENEDNKGGLYGKECTSPISDAS